MDRHRGQEGGPRRVVVAVTPGRRVVRGQLRRLTGQGQAMRTAEEPEGDGVGAGVTLGAGEPLAEDAARLYVDRGPLHQVGVQRRAEMATAPGLGSQAAGDDSA